MRQKITYSALTDDQLINRLINGDKRAFHEIYDRYVEELYRYAYHILQDDAACQDAVQELFIWLWDQKSTLRVTRLKAYLTAAIRYRLVREIQVSRRREEILSKFPLSQEYETTDSLELQELQNLIDAMVDTLPPRAREIFCLSRREYLSTKEIATKLSLSEKTVENQLTIALRKIRVGIGRFYTFLF